MIKYIKIANCMSGNSIPKQIQDIVDAGMMDKDTRLFFNRGNLLTMEDIDLLLTYFDIRKNNEINNVVFAPRDHFIKSFVENGVSFKDKNGKNA